MGRRTGLLCSFIKMLREKASYRILQEQLRLVLSGIFQERHIQSLLVEVLSLVLSVDWHHSETQSAWENQPQGKWVLNQG